MADGTRSSSISRPPPIAEAVRRRAPLATRADLTAYRLFHGQAEGCPGLAIDRYGAVAIIHTARRELAERWLPTIKDALLDLRGAYLKIHPRQASRLTDQQRRELGPSDPVWGPVVDDVTVLEHGTRYLIRPRNGLSVGLFLDMRHVRNWLRSQAGDRSVLNLFAYTCSLGVSAALGGASRVLNLDLSRNYLEWGKANYALNGLPVDPRDFVYGDAFDWLTRFARHRTHFDLVIVDPPSFSSTPFAVRRDYPRLVHAAAQVIAPAGMLLAATNYTGISDEHFDAWLRDGLHAAGRSGHLVHSWHEPTEDFPVAAGSTPYLKVRALALD